MCADHGLVDVQSSVMQSTRPYCGRVRQKIMEAVDVHRRRGAPVVRHAGSSFSFSVEIVLGEADWTTTSLGSKSFSTMGAVDLPEAAEQRRSNAILLW